MYCERIHISSRNLHVLLNVLALIYAFADADRAEPDAADGPQYDDSFANVVHLFQQLFSLPSQICQHSV